MGTFIYNDTLRLELDDCSLEHLRFVVFEKLRQRESFVLTWVRPGSGANGAPRSTSLWISPEIPIGFEAVERDESELSRERVESMMKSSYSNRGLVIEAE